MVVYWIGQAIGVIAMIESFFIYQVSSRRKMLALKLIDDLLWTIHFITLGGITGALTTGISITRGLVFYNKGTKKWASSPWWAVGYSLIYLACAPLTWSGISSIFPPLASAMATWGFWIDKTEHGKIIHALVAACMLAYAIVLHSYSGILTQVVTISSIVIFFIKLMHGKKTKKSEVVK